MAEPKKVDLIVIDAVKVDGKHFAVGDVLKDCDPELAKELTAAGRTRLATPEEVAAATKAKKAVEA